MAAKRELESAPPLIADVLRDAIRQRLLPPGMPLVQGAIADALGVSRVPVREALHSLASEGLVTFAEDGAHVTALQPGEITELWSLRALLEPALATAIVSHIGPTELAEVERLVQRMDGAEDGDTWSDLNYRFHVELARLARLPHYATAAVRVLTLIEPYSRVAVNRLAGRDAAQAEHREMLTALERRDAAALREVLGRHSLRARDLLVDYAESDGITVSRTEQTSEAARAFAGRLFAAGRDTGGPA